MRTYIFFLLLCILNCTKKNINESKISPPLPNKIFTLFVKNGTKDTIILNFFHKDILKNLDSNTNLFTSYLVPKDSTVFYFLYDTFRYYYLDNLVTKKYYGFFIQPFSLTPPKSGDVAAVYDTLPTAECPMRLYFGRKKILRLKYQNFIIKDTNAKYKSFYNVHNYTKLGKLGNEELLKYTFTEKDYLLADTIIN